MRGHKRPIKSQLSTASVTTLPVNLPVPSLPGFFLPNTTLPSLRNLTVATLSTRENQHPYGLGAVRPGLAVMKVATGNDAETAAVVLRRPLRRVVGLRLGNDRRRGRTRKRRWTRRRCRADCRRRTNRRRRWRRARKRRRNRRRRRTWSRWWRRRRRRARWRAVDLQQYHYNKNCSYSSMYKINLGGGKSPSLCQSVKLWIIRKICLKNGSHSPKKPVVFVCSVASLCENPITYIYFWMLIQNTGIILPFWNNTYATNLLLKMIGSKRKGKSNVGITQKGTQKWLQT